MINCPSCGKQLPDGSRFCKFCGSPVSQMPQVPVQINAQKPASQNKKKKSAKKVILAIIAIILAIAIGFCGWLLWDVIADKNKDVDGEEKLKELLEESTTKPIIEFVYDDYDSDGTYEAYAIVGESDDEDDEEHPEFYDADIYFINPKEAQPIKENISGKYNDFMKIKKAKYISIEIYDEGTKTGKSFIYTVDGEDSVEPEISISL